MLVANWLLKSDTFIYLAIKAVDVYGTAPLLGNSGWSDRFNEIAFST